jgi:hypothetical protein
MTNLILQSHTEPLHHTASSQHHSTASMQQRSNAAEE